MGTTESEEGMTRQQIILVRGFVRKYGMASQEDMAIEECSELIKAILKYRRNPSIEAREAIAEEIADVEIMLEQLKYMFCCSGEVAEQVAYKINRQWERMMKNE